MIHVGLKNIERKRMLLAEPNGRRSWCFNQKGEKRSRGKRQNNREIGKITGKEHYRSTQDMYSHGFRVKRKL